MTRVVCVYMSRKNGSPISLATGNIGRCNQYARVYPWDPEKTHRQDELDYLQETRQNLFADPK